MIHPQGTYINKNDKLQRFEVSTSCASLDQVFQGLWFIDQLVKVETDHNDFVYGLYTLGFKDVTPRERAALMAIEKSLIELTKGMVLDRQGKKQ
jgi:hypothetical protein